LPILFGLGYIYLGMLLLRLKRNAWLMGLLLSVSMFALNLTTLADRYSDGLHLRPFESVVRLALPLLVFAMLFVSRDVFRVRSDRVGFRQAVRASAVVLIVALLYGTVGYIVLDRHDFHQEISLAAAMHQTIDQFGITTPNVVPHTVRARLFTDSLSVLSIGVVVSVALAFFQPIRFTLRPQYRERDQAQDLLTRFPSDIDDFFKLWPQDKHYFFDASHEAGLAYHVAQGVALVVGDPFGDPRRFPRLLRAFQELCFVNDWRPAFVHIGDHNHALYKKLGYSLQKIGEEAVLDLETFQAERNSKYFRQIRNRFIKQGYRVALLEPPFDLELMRRLQHISQMWLERPGRAERGFMLGSFSAEYMERSRVAIVCDGEGVVRGFMNIVPTFEAYAANYDLLRCAPEALGNCNDFLLMELIDILHADGIKSLNLGLCPLKGLDEAPEVTGIIDAALRFVYANGDRFYSFTGLTRFKAKYHPAWEARSVAYMGGPAGFAHTMTALTRAMRIKK
jgi:phosphatidylglycerol lysyltransferase